MMRFSNLFLFIIILLSSTNCLYSNNTPTRAEWVRVIFIGTNDSNYFVYYIHSHHKGTYYEYTDSIFLCKYTSSNNSLLDKILLRTVIHFDSLANDNWFHINSYTNFNVEKYLSDNNASYALPSKRLSEFIIEIMNYEMIMKYNKFNKSEIVFNTESFESKTVGLLNNNWMQKDSFNITDLHLPLNLLEYYNDKNYYYFIIENSEKYLDVDYYQFVLTKPVDDIKKIIRSLKYRK